jgi:hypothetical protein
MSNHVSLRTSRRDATRLLAALLASAWSGTPQPASRQAPQGARSGAEPAPATASPRRVTGSSRRGGRRPKA